MLGMREVPRMMKATEVAAFLGRSRSWFATRRSLLEAIGFPRPHPIIGLYDREQIVRWLDAQAGLTTPTNPFDEAFGI